MAWQGETDEAGPGGARPGMARLGGAWLTRQHEIEMRQRVA